MSQTHNTFSCYVMATFSCNIPPLVWFPLTLWPWVSHALWRHWLSTVLLLHSWPGLACPGSSLLCCGCQPRCVHSHPARPVLPVLASSCVASRCHSCQQECWAEPGLSVSHPTASSKVQAGQLSRVTDAAVFRRPPPPPDAEHWSRTRSAFLLASLRMIFSSRGNSIQMWIDSWQVCPTGG